VAVALLVAGCGWEQSRFDAGRSGSNPFERAIGAGSLARLEPVWTEPDVTTEAIVQSGRVFAQDNDEIHAVDAATGTPIWSAPLSTRPDGWVRLPVGVATARTPGGTEVVLSADVSWWTRGPGPVQEQGALTAFDAATGAPIWTSSIHPNSAPVVRGQTVLVVAQEGEAYPFDFSGLVALDLATGATLYRAPFGDIGPALAVTNGGLAVVGTSTGIATLPVGGCGAAQCSFGWSGVGQSQYRAQIATVGDWIYVAGNAGIEVYPSSGCGASTCAPTWRGSGDFTGVAVANDNVFVTGSRTSWMPSPLAAFSATGCGASTCTPTWQSTESEVFGAPTVANGVVFAAALHGPVVAWPVAGCGAAACSGTWKMPIEEGAGATTIADGRLFVSAVGIHAYALAP